MSWLLVYILVAIFFITRHRSAATRSERKLSDLFVLRLELERLQTAGQIDQTTCEDAIRRIDSIGLATLKDLKAVPESSQWDRRRDAAWSLLNREQFFFAGPPPWQNAKQLHNQWRSHGVPDVHSVSVRACVYEET